MYNKRGEKMKRQTKKLVLVLGVISLILGISLMIPSFLQKVYLGLGAGILLVILGVILFALGYGD